nr:hypothetical protein [Tanacetum cinerariifolium]
MTSPHTPLVEKINMVEKQILEGTCVLANDASKTLKKVDYLDDHDIEDAVEPVDNDMANFLASKPSRVEYENIFEVLKLLENRVDVLKILENKLESMKILENKLESLKLQENQPVDGLVPLFIKKFTSESVFKRMLKSKDNKKRHLKTQFGWKEIGQAAYPPRDLKPRVKKITDDKGLISIWFEWDDKKTLMPLDDHASHWSNYLGELIREMFLYYPSWQKEEMLRLQALGSNTPSGVPYTKEEINALARKGKQRGHLPGVGKVLLGRAIAVLSSPPPQCTHNSANVEKLKKKNKYQTKQREWRVWDDEMADDEDDEDEEDDDS